MKRDYLDTDSEEDDDSKRYDSAPQTVARKKRRGVIEKRRRDRINNSLSELRRMVPTAYEKHGSAKLEKAEILQLTVEHLKTLQSAISKGYFPFVDVHSMAVDYRSFGFRECVSEVAKYMVTSDPADTQVPIRNKLLNHLQNMLSQKEAAGAMTKAAPVSIPPWSSIPALNNVINPGSNVITPGNNVISPGMLPHRHNLPGHRDHPPHMTPQLHLPLSPAFLLSDRRPARLEASMFSPKRKLPPHLDTRTSPFASTMLTPAFQPRSHHLFSKASNDHFGIFTNFGSFPTRKHDRYFNPAKDSAFREIPPIETQPASDPEKIATTNLSSTPPPKRATNMDTPPHRPWSLELSAH